MARPRPTSVSVTYTGDAASQVVAGEDGCLSTLLQIVGFVFFVLAVGGAITFFGLM